MRLELSTIRMSAFCHLLPQPPPPPISTLPENRPPLQAEEIEESFAAAGGRCAIMAELPAAEVSPRKFSLNSHPVDDDPVPAGARVLRFAEPATEKPAKTTKESQSSRKKKGKRTTRKRSRRGATTPVLALLMGVLSVYARVLSLFSSVHQMCVYLVVDVLIGVAEEIAKCSSRETLRQVLRFANSIPAFFVSLVDDKFFWRKMRRAYNKGYGAEGAWTQFWEQSMERSSSFNALFELDETAKGGQGAREVRKGEGRKREALEELKI